ncbi:MAG: FAD-dependent oxidoreductase [Nitriliruptoraceae bacterium]
MSTASSDAGAVSPDGAGTEVVVAAVVVGAGPAGMAAAVALAEAGVAVHVLDTYQQPGGQYHRTRTGALTIDHPDPVVRSYLHHLEVGTINHHGGTTVWTATVEEPAVGAVGRSTEPAVGAAGRSAEAAAGSAGRLSGPRIALHLTGLAGAEPPAATLCTEVVVLATGATDRVLPFPGWDLPGVVTAGAAQALLKGHGVRVGERAVVGGSGPFLLPVAAALAEAGTEVVTVAEARSAHAIARAMTAGAPAAGPTDGAAVVPRGARDRAGTPGWPPLWRHRRTFAEGAGYAATLARHRVAVAPATAVTAATSVSPNQT